MDALTCIKKLGYVGVLDFATVAEDGAPQVRNIAQYTTKAQTSTS